MTIKTFGENDYNRAAEHFESMGLPLDMLEPPQEMDWILHRRGSNQSTLWKSGPWTAEISKTTEGRQLVAHLHLAGDDVFMLDSVLIEPENIPQGMTFESFESDMLARFAAWIDKNGREALADAPVTLKIQTRHAHALLDAIQDFMKLANDDQDFDLTAAVIALRSQLRRAL